jgi:ligand-binding SRPBCC domain-containing protein
MAIHTLQRTLTFPATLAEAWDYFSSPRNLSRITPPEMGFEIRTPDLPPVMYEGMMIAYTVRPLLGVPMSWLTEITRVRPLEYFVDEQRVGPYSIWHHEHWFRDAGGGQVEMRDKITYVLPFGPLGDLAHPILVAPQLRRIFDFRETAVRELFPG